MRFGFAAERMALNVLADTDPNGIWNFDTLQDFLMNNPTKFQGGIASTLSPRNLRQTIYGLYLQDDWRFRPNLTLNLGLRYEMSTIARETSGKLSNLPDLSSATPHLGNPFISNPTLKNFEPRVGFAWDPFRNGKTAVRGGVYLCREGGVTVVRVDEANLVIPTLTPAGYVWPFDSSGNPPDPINTNFGSIRGMFYEGHSYYNALEAQLAKRMSHGFQMQGTFTWGKSMDTSSATVAGDSFGNSISSLHWFDLRLSRGLSDFDVGRTFVLNGTWEAPTPKALPASARWALGGWELGLILTASDGVPFTPSWGTGSDPSNTNSGDDWAFPNRLGGPGCKTLTNPGNPTHYIKTECFAVPTAPNMAFWQAKCDPKPPSVGDLVAFPLCFNLRGNAGRNILIGPGLTEMDFSIFKNNYIPRISEKFNVQFRAEIFNILNHPNFAPPATPNNTDIFDGTGTLSPVAGLLTKTTTTARQVQFAIKVMF